MPWYDIGLYILVPIAVLALIGLAWAVLQILIMCVVGFWPRKEEPVRMVETPVGTFRTFGDRWIADAVMGRDLTVWVEDRDGVPDPDFVAGLPDLLAALPEYERRAREYEVLLDYDPFPDEDEDEDFVYELAGITQADGVLHPGAEFELNFKHPRHEGVGIDIVFAGGQPIDSDSYDH